METLTLRAKHDKLRQYLRELGNVAIAFSGGVDSTFLLKTAHDELGDKAIAVTARSHSFPEHELDEAVEFCESEGIRHVMCDVDHLAIEGFSQNPENRCYLCKDALFTKIWAAARENQIENIAEGSNTDDDADCLPGLNAVSGHGVKSPLLHAGLSKQEIRALSKEMGLPVWNRPSFACLFSRFPYGESITAEKLGMVSKAERMLLELGLRQARVRVHGNLARIETDESGFYILSERQSRKSIHDAFRQIGFTYVSADLFGYRTESMNESAENAPA